MALQYCWFIISVNGIAFRTWNWLLFALWYLGPPYLIDPWGIWLQSQISEFHTHFNDTYLEYFLWNCNQLNATTPHWSLINIGSGNGLVPSGNKPLPEPMLTQIIAPYGVTGPQWVKGLTCWVLKPEYSARTSSIQWLLMPWLLVVPGHQQKWHWLSRINGGPLSSMRSDFNNLCLLSIEKWLKIQI